MVRNFRSTQQRMRFIRYGDKVLCVDADGVVCCLQWDETREVLTNAKGVMFEPADFVEFCLGQAR